MDQFNHYKLERRKPGREKWRRIMGQQGTSLVSHMGQKGTSLASHSQIS
jgi:hypothetical protein